MEIESLMIGLLLGLLVSQYLNKNFSFSITRRGIKKQDTDDSVDWEKKKT